MPTNVIMPQMGESIFEGTLTRWLKRPGDKINRDEPLFEISTDKVDAEIPSPAAGVLSRILVNEGQTVQINTVVAEIDEGGGAGVQPKAADLPQAKAEMPAKTGAPPAARPPKDAMPEGPTGEVAAPIPGAEGPPANSAAEFPQSRAPERAPEARQPQAAGQERSAPVAGAEDVRSSPLVRKLAAEYGVDLRQITGTGLGGRVTKNDIMAHLEQRGVQAPEEGAPPAEPARATPQPTPMPSRPAAPAAGAPAAAPRPAGDRVQSVPLSTMRQKIAEHMVMSKRTSAHVTTVFEVDMTRIAKLREQHKAEFNQQNGVKLTYMPFIARAAINALKEFPYVNASLEGTNVLLKKDINLGIAVALDWGLIVPVIKNADEKNLVGVARAIRDLADRARNKKLSPDDVQGGTFTITNPGGFGALFGTPIINQPQVAIMGVGAIYKAPVVVDDAIAIHWVGHLTLSFDHRLIDGALADQFMAHVKKTLENWEEPLQ